MFKHEDDHCDCFAKDRFNTPGRREIIDRAIARAKMSETTEPLTAVGKIIAERGFSQESNIDVLNATIDTVFATNPEVLAEYRVGDDGVRKKKRGFLMGEASKALKGRANGKLLAELLDAKLGRDE